ncbi:MAG: hypothetical protein FWE88_01405 [Phycisphaerae bacterium]|nr:hypothetical protein [Phycisphaerae bacterium]
MSKLSLVALTLVVGLGLVMVGCSGETDGNKPAKADKPAGNEAKPANAPADKAEPKDIIDGPNSSIGFDDDPIVPNIPADDDGDDDDDDDNGADDDDDDADNDDDDDNDD